MKIRSGWFSGGQHHQNEIVAAPGGVAAAQFLILKIGKRLAVLTLNFVHGEVMRELHCDDTIARTPGAQVPGGLALQR